MQHKGNAFKQVNASFEGQTRSMCDKTSPNKDLLRAKLIGDANEGVIYVSEEEVIALIDTGAMVSTISEGFYESMESQSDLKDLSALRLDLKAANGEKYHI